MSLRSTGALVGSWQIGDLDMFCTKCGNEAPDGAAACPNCGAALDATTVGGAQAAPPGSFAAPPAAPGAAPGVAYTAGGTGQFAFNINRLTVVERVIGIASFVLIIALFLPFLRASATETVDGSTTTLGSVSISGYSLHGYFWIVFVLALAVIAFLVMKAGFATMPFRLPIADDQALLIATGIMFVIVLLGFLFNGYGFGDSYNAGVPGIDSVHAGISRSFGAYLSLVVAIVAFVPLGRPAIQKQINKQRPTA